MGYTTITIRGATISIGNHKIGDCDIYNRPVGRTCPLSCPFLGNGCYAETTEKRFPLARDVGMRNIGTSSDAIADILRFAHLRRRALRLHERGDFGNGSRNGIDQQYLSALRAALRRVKRGGALPTMWTYTHIYRAPLAKLDALGVNMYASVHNRTDIGKAKRAGFKRLAIVLPYRSQTCRLHAGMPRYSGAQFITTHNKIRALVCPAQYNRSNKKVTCADCKWCVYGRGHVAFLNH